MLRLLRQIVEILRKSEDDYTEEDYEHMKKVRSYINRHTKQVRLGTSAMIILSDVAWCADSWVAVQRPDKSEEELDHMKWTYSLKNWGHDPLKHEQ